MKKIHLYYAAIFLFMICLADTCRFGGNKKTECPTFYINQETKDYCVFKEGRGGYMKTRLQKEKIRWYCQGALFKFLTVEID